MKTIPFTKAHGAGNDFLLTLKQDAPRTGLDEIARRICDRHSGVGADGWMLIDLRRTETADLTIRLFNSDGSEPELSGNGTRCAAAFAVRQGVPGDSIRIATGAGISAPDSKRLPRDCVTPKRAQKRR